MKCCENIIYRRVSSCNDLQKAFFVRGVVFIEEQRCLYVEEFDEYDCSSTHFLATIGDEPIAAARIRLLLDCVKIERLSVRQMYRGNSIGKRLFSFILKYIEQLGYQKVIIHAQSNLLKFYEKFGFVKHGEMFKEARIDHYYMDKIDN